MGAILDHVFSLLIFLVIISGPVPIALEVLSTYFPERPSFYHTGFLLLTLWSIISVSLVMGLGILSSLTLRRILFGEVVLFFVGCWLIYRRKNSAAHVFSSWSAQMGSLGRWERSLIGLYGFQGIVNLWLMITTPISEYDSLAYHLPNMASWFQTGSLERIPNFGQTSYYPYTWEAFSTLFLFPFNGDFLAGFPNWIAVFISCLSIVVISMEFGAERIKSVLAAGLFLSIPILTRHILTMGVDLAFSAFFTAGIAAILLFHRTRLPAYLAVFIAASGAVIGIKMSGMIYVGLSLAVLIFLEAQLRMHRKRHASDALRNQASLKQMKNILVVFAAALIALVIGGYWYGLNWREIGNPLGYVPVKAATWVIFPGSTELKYYAPLADRQAYFAIPTPLKEQGVDQAAVTFGEYVRWTSLARLFNFGSPEDWKVLAEEVINQIGYPFIILSIFSLILVFSTAWHTRHPIGVMSILICLGLLSATWVIYWFTPYSGDNGSHNWMITPWIGQAIRYAFPFLSILAVSAACGATAVGFSDTRMALFTGVSMVIFYYQTQMLLAPTALIFGLWLVGKAAQTRSFSMLWKQKRLGLVLGGIGLIIILAAGLSGFGLQVRFNRQDVTYGGIYGSLEKWTEKGSKIGYISSPHLYLLFGRRLDRVPVNVAASEETQHRDWLKNIKRNNIRLVAYGPLKGESWKETNNYLWLTDANDFERIFGSDAAQDLVIYKLRNRE